MTRRTSIVISLVCLAACSPSPSAAPSSAPALAADPADSCTPNRELAALDTRRPVPLTPMMAWHQKQNMMDHLVAIERVTEALSRDDWTAAEEASTAIGTSPQMQQMCEHMGAGAEGFTELALDFHRRADGIAEAARAHDGPRVLRATAHTLEACTSCHATYRQQLVDADAFSSVAGAAPRPH